MVDTYLDEKEFDRIHKKFIQSVREWNVYLKKIYEKLPNIDNEALSTISSQAHKIAGSAKAFDYKTISETAYNLEQVILEIKEEGDNSDYEKQAKLKFLIYSLTLMIDKIRSKVTKNLNSGNQKNLAAKTPGHRVVIADDDEIIIELVEYMLKYNGCEVLSVENGKELLEKAPDFKPELIILDINMPEMDGFTTVENIKQNDQLKYLPIMMLTRKEAEKDVKKAIALGI